MGPSHFNQTASSPATCSKYRYNYTKYLYEMEFSAFIIKEVYFDIIVGEEAGLCFTLAKFGKNGQWSRELLEQSEIDSLVGHILHSSILLPYHGWRIGHWTHHQNPGHVKNDEPWHREIKSMSNDLVANSILKAESEGKNPETMKSYVWVQTAEGFTQAVEEEVPILCPTFNREIQSGFGSSKDSPISGLPRVRATSLSLVFDYCRFHKVRRSLEEHKTFDENFLQMDARSLCELITLAQYLQLKSLINCTCAVMAQRISHNSTEEIWHMLKLSDDLPEVEKLESRGHSAFDSRIRLLEKLYKKKKQTVVEEIENLKNFMAGLKAGQHEDTRQVDDLVSFINGGDGETQTSKKGKNRKKRAQKKISSSITTTSSEASASRKVIENHAKDSNDIDSANARGPPADTSKLYGIQDESFSVQNYFDDNDMDPALREAIHREVVELARKFNLNMLILFESGNQTRSSYRWN